MASIASRHLCFNTVNGKRCCNRKQKEVSVIWVFASFNTVNGSCYCLIIFVLPSLRSSTCDVWASSSLCSSAASHSAAHTVNDKHYFGIIFVLPSLRSSKRSANLIIALLLCRLAPFGAYRKR